MKKVKSNQSAHTSNSKMGMGDYYGTGVKQKVGRIVSNFDSAPVSNKKMGKPPKSLA